MKMKRSKVGLLVAPPIVAKKNVGDYIQSIAAKIFYPDFDQYVERESINNVELEEDERIKVVMNAWWMWRGENWPPHPAIDPLMISMHISPLVAHEMLSESKIGYMRDHAPIGCRDTGTMKLLQDRGVECYFSGCMTLCLGDKYLKSPEIERKGVIFVDPFIPITNRGKDIYYRDILRGIWAFVQHPLKSAKLRRRVGIYHNDKLKRYFRAAMFYKTYSALFDDELLFNAEFVSHILWVDPQQCSNDYYMDYAEELLRRYSEAKLVVTSRIHCALPCLALETPVLFVDSCEMNDAGYKFNTPNRFGGLKELFEVVDYDDRHRLNVSDSVAKIIGGGKILESTPLKNKDGWRTLRDDLRRRCDAFFGR